METDLTLASGLADLEAEIKAGRLSLREALGELVKALRAQPAVEVAAPSVQVAAPAVSVPVTVQPAPPIAWDAIEHTHIYDDVGRIVKTISRRVAKEA